MGLDGDLTFTGQKPGFTAWYGTRVASLPITVFELRATIARADSSCYFLGGRGRDATFLEGVVPFPHPSTAG